MHSFLFNFSISNPRLPLRCYHWYNWHGATRRLIIGTFIFSARYMLSHPFMLRSEKTSQHTEEGPCLSDKSTNTSIRGLLNHFFYCRIKNALQFLPLLTFLALNFFLQKNLPSLDIYPDWFLNCINYFILVIFCNSFNLIY